MDLELEAKNWMKERQLSGITAAEYQVRACETAIFPSTGPQSILLLALTGEAGEIANKVKKFIRDGATKDEYLAKRIEIGYEIGDVLWYCAVLAEELEHGPWTHHGEKLRETSRQEEARDSVGIR